MKNRITTLLAFLLSACAGTAALSTSALGDTFTIPSTVDLTFDTGANRQIYVLDSTSTTNGYNLTLRPGKGTGAPANGGYLYLLSGDGASATETQPAGYGGDLRIHGGDAGAARDSSGTAGNHGGNIHIYGGLGTNSVAQHGGILIGEETTDEIRIGHKPVYGTMNQGHIRHIGYLADSSSIHPSDVYTLRFGLNGTGHLLDGDKQVPGGGLGLPLTFRSGAGGDATSSAAAGQGGHFIIKAANGGAGNSTYASGFGASLRLYGGDGGTAGAGGGNTGGHVEIDGGQGSGTSIGGDVYIGAASWTHATYIGHDGAGTFIAGLLNPTLVSTSGAQTIKVADYASAGAGQKLTIRSGKGGSGSNGNGGDLAVAPGDSSGGPYGGSMFLDGGAGSSAANAGYVLVGVNAPQSAGATAKVQVGDATQLVSLFSSGSFAGGKGVLFVGNADTVPTGTPSGGGIIYVESGYLKYKGPSGTVTTLAVP